jgi:subtilase family serine protease
MPASSPVPRFRRQGRHRRLVLEQLEDRTLPSVSPITFTYLYANKDINEPVVGYPNPVATALPPAGLSKAYGLNLLNGDGTGETIAIVDAYDNPSIISRSPTAPVASDAPFLASDLHQFDMTYDLPEPTGFFTKVNQQGGTIYPQNDPYARSYSWGDWEGEESLDVEWVHALAPGAKIVLVEANDAMPANLYAAVAWAGSQSGAQVVLMNWGQSEYSGETGSDSAFAQPAGHGVTYVAATGVFGAPGLYPAYSPDVLAVGGTTLNVDVNDNYFYELGWGLGSDTYAPTEASGGGISQYEPQPTFQSSLTQYAPYRTIPDVSFDGDPSTGVSVYDFFNGQVPSSAWYAEGGTSVGGAAWAALISIADQLRTAGGPTFAEWPGPGFAGTVPSDE